MKNHHALCWWPCFHWTEMKSFSRSPLNPTTGLTGHLPFPSPAHESGGTHLATYPGEAIPVTACCRENLAAPRVHPGRDFQEEQILADIPPRKYLEKIVLELSGEQHPLRGHRAAIVQDALRKARKESDLGDRASLVTYLARAFLQGREEPRGQHSPKPPYQVVLHHESGITWVESERGPVYVPDTVYEKALCDAEIVEVKQPMRAITSLLKERVRLFHHMRLKVSA